MVIFLAASMAGWKASSLVVT
jgi:hypothetical protein